MAVMKFLRIKYSFKMVSHMVFVMSLVNGSIWLMVIRIRKISGAKSTLNHMIK